MKILVAHWRPDIVSGAELAIADMVAKRSDGIEYLMLTPGEGALADYYRRRGFSVWAQEIHTRRRLYPGLHTVQSVWFARKLRRSGVDVVLCNTFPAAGRVGTACRLAGAPYAIYIREFIRNIPRHRRALLQADMTLAVTKDVADYLRGILGSDRALVAHDHLDMEPIRKRLERHRTCGSRLLPFGVEHPVVGIVGRVTVYKQQDVFLRAVPFVLAEVPKARFVVVGTAVEREKKYEQGLWRLAEDLGVANRVVFTGQRQDAVEIISELSVCCLTSDRDLFPRIILEAQFVGCPVVASDTGGCPEMIEDGVTGLLFPVASQDAPQQLAAQVVRLLRDRELALRLSESARARLGNTFGSLRPVRELEQHLRDLAETRRAGTHENV